MATRLIGQTQQASKRFITTMSQQQKGITCSAFDATVTTHVSRPPLRRLKLIRQQGTWKRELSPANTLDNYRASESRRDEQPVKARTSRVQPNPDVQAEKRRRIDETLDDAKATSQPTVDRIQPNVGTVKPDRSAPSAQKATDLRHRLLRSFLKSRRPTSTGGRQGTRPCDHRSIVSHCAQ